MVLDDCRLKLHKLAEIVGISKILTNRILSQIWDMKKICVRWMPRLLSPLVQKQRREEVSIKSLAMFRRNTAEFLHQFLTVDEIWVHYYTSETKQQSKQWTERGKSAPKKALDAILKSSTVLTISKVSKLLKIARKII